MKYVLLLTTMQVSVIIVNYNVSDFLHQCLLSVEKALQPLQGEIIVVDNHSQDDSCFRVQRHFPNIRLIPNKKNLGFAKANNLGIDAAIGKYILILNPDTILPEDALNKLYNFAEENPQLGAIGVPMYDGGGNFLRESKRNVPTSKVALKKLLGFDKEYYASNLTDNADHEVPILTGAFMWVEKSKLLEAGKFDEDYFMYGEDVDLSFKIAQKGYPNYYFTGTQIIHYKGESTFKDLKYLKNFYQAMSIFYQKRLKKGFVDAFLIKSGVYFWQVVNRFQLVQKPVPGKINPKNILYVGSDNALFEKLQVQFLYSKIHVHTVCETRVISRFDELENIKKMISEHQIDTIIFDHQTNPYSKIIFYIISLPENKVYYYIRPAKTGFLIGSPDKNSKGIIIHLS